MKVNLWRVTDAAEALIAEAYGICTNKNVPVKNIPKWIKMGHESPLEHASATFLIEGISRACLAQLTRHRLASFSVQSMRYVNVGRNEAIFPSSISVDDDSSWHLYKRFLAHAQSVYKQLMDSGVPKEDARMVLPLATTTNLFMTANFREWRHVIKLRTNLRAQWEIRALAGQIFWALYDVAPHVFGDIKDV